jgi:hypothetical protein
MLVSHGQKRRGFVSGRITDENGRPLPGASVQLLNNERQVVANDSGYFLIELQALKPVSLVFSYTGYMQVQKNFYLASEENETAIIQLHTTSNQLPDIIIRDDRQRTESGRISIDASRALVNPSPVMSVESLIKVFVGSNNELTSQYTVRGGSFDENLVYVNDFEVYRPFLVRSGQQEGLSFINPEMTGNIKFYAGGFQTKYGDKISSVLDVTYKKPSRFGGSIYLGLLEQGLHLEGISDNKKFTYLVGARNRSNRNLLSTQSTQGNYIPASGDIQALLGWQVSEKWKLEWLGNYAATRFTFFPEKASLSSSVFSPVYSGTIGLDVFMEGSERSSYGTVFSGLSILHQKNTKNTYKALFSYYKDDENENFDITGAYLFGQRNDDNNSADFGQITNPLGAGINQNYARNTLQIDIYSVQMKGQHLSGRHVLQWGQTIDRQFIKDGIREFEYRDSAGYSLPYEPGSLSLFSSVNGDASLQVSRLSGYVQDNFRLGDSTGLTMQAGLRYNYNTLNKEWLISPRLNISFIPSSWKKDIILKASAGLYQQPPFYREMRRFDGTVNKNLLAQKSLQFTAGIDYNLQFLQRPARISSELYYKKLWDVVPYDIDNVRLRFYGNNNAKAWAAGWETRFYGELVNDAESWVSLSIMRTKENLSDDFFTQYFNAAGQLITGDTEDKVPVDSSVNEVGWLRRPSDRLITFGMFLQDYLSTNKNFKAFLTMLVGSNLPYNIPGSIRYRNALEIDPYIRIDMGFSALLISTDKSLRRSHSPFKNFESLWASIEIFNVIDRPNVISYQLVKDFANFTYALPNRLTPRMLNFKIAARW